MCKALGSGSWEDQKGDMGGGTAMFPLDLSKRVPLKKAKTLKALLLGSPAPPSKEMHILKAITLKLNCLPHMKQCRFFLPEISSNSKTLTEAFQCHILPWFGLQGFTFCKLIVCPGIFL